MGSDRVRAAYLIGCMVIALALAIAIGVKAVASLSRDARPYPPGIPDDVKRATDESG